MSRMEINSVLTDVQFVGNVFTHLLNVLPPVQIGDPAVLPFGLKPHTRSVSWIAEQVITQNLRFHSHSLGLSSVRFDMPDASLHNCEIVVGNKKYWVNVKIHGMSKSHSKSDIAAVEKMYNQYMNNPEYNVIYVCFGVNFVGTSIEFDRNYLKVFSAQFIPVYVNPRNDKIQALYHHAPQHRTRSQFLAELAANSRSIQL